MGDVRYLRFALGKIDGELGQPEGELGRFAKLDGPMPVGTELEVDGQRLRVTRVDENQGGCWLGAAQARRDEAAPVVIVSDPTTRDLPPMDATVPNAAPDADAPGDSDGDEPRGRKRRPKKTVAGR
jgi:hypothetical protein